MKKILIPLGIAAILIACSEQETLGAKEQTGKVESNIDADAELPEDLRKELAKNQKEMEEAERKLEATMTSLKFDKEIHDFGTVKAETDVVTQFVVTNTGKRPLIIEHVSASCGCTTPKKPEGPIAPGASDVIEVKFKSKPGQLNEINKTVTVQANTKEQTHQVQIRAFVVQ